MRDALLLAAALYGGSTGADEGFRRDSGGDDRCGARGDFERGRRIRVAFVHHAMHMGGVERQIRLTCASIDRARISPEVVLFQEEGEWAGSLEADGIPVRLFRVWRDNQGLQDRHEVEFQRLVDYLAEGVDVVHTWYGGGSLGSFGTFSALAARRYVSCPLSRICGTFGGRCRCCLHQARIVS